MTAPTQTVIPQLRMTDAARSLQFYVDGLGFAVDWEHRFEPGYPLFAQLSRDSGAGKQLIFLTQHCGDCEAGGAVYFIVPDARATLAAFAARGIWPTNPLEATPWGSWEFLLTDPDGNRLRFASEQVSPAADETAGDQSQA